MKLLSCHTCHGLSRTKCRSCGRRLPTKMTDAEKFKYQCRVTRIKELEPLWLKLRKFNMSGTQCATLDAELLKEFGPWKRSNNGASA